MATIHTEQDGRSGNITVASLLLLVSIILVQFPLGAQPQPGPINWHGFQFLIGEWVGEGTGAPGEGSGSFKLCSDLQNTVLVRTNHTEFPATKDRPAFSHDDLMIVYQKAGETKAAYWDNERHVLHYRVAFSKDSSSVVFVTDPSASTPRFRLSYGKLGTDRVEIMFEMAPTGRPEAFTRYLLGTARRKK